MDHERRHLDGGEERPGVHVDFGFHVLDDRPRAADRALELGVPGAEPLVAGSTGKQRIEGLTAAPALLEPAHRLGELFG